MTMSVVSNIHSAGFPNFTLTSGDNEVVVSAFGGQILSWTKSGVPIVFENRDRAILDGKTAYRGGAPVCFPYFGKGVLLPLGTTLNPAHGRARTTIWDAEVRDNTVVLTTSQPSPEGYGPTVFECELVVELDDSLRIRATLRNAGANEAPVQLALHTYWAAADPAAAQVFGLGNRYLDNLLDLTEHVEDDSSEPHSTPVDRVYLDAAGSQEILTEAYRLEISTQGCSGVVLWNPGNEHSIKDLGSPDFICVESGLIVPSKSLLPGEQYLIEVTCMASLS